MAEVSGADISINVAFIDIGFGGIIRFLNVDSGIKSERKTYRLAEVFGFMVYDLPMVLCKERIQAAHFLSRVFKFHNIYSSFSIHHHHHPPML